MPFRDETDHSTILDTFYRYARVEAVDPTNDLADITILDADDNPTSEAWTQVPLFYHCDGDAALRPNGALTGAAAAFDPGDKVVVQFMDGSPLVVGFHNLLKPCAQLTGVFIASGGSSITLYDVEGDPFLGTLNFTNPRFWGSAFHVWFIRKEYWALDGGAVKYNAHGEATRNPADEVSCSGLPTTIGEFNVRKEASTYYLTATFQDDTVARQYVSTDGKTWTFNSTITFDNGPTALEGFPTPTAGGGWFEVDTDRFFAEHQFRKAHETGYPSEYFRLYRIGKKTRWDQYGVLNTVIEPWTEIADATSEIQFTFEIENSFSVDGGFGGLQILQVTPI